MSTLHQNAGGDLPRNSGNLTAPMATDTAGAPTIRLSTAAALAASGASPRAGGATAPKPGAPQWIQLLPAGSFRGRDGRGPFHLDNASAVIAATEALRMEAGIPVDYDHATDFAAPKGRPAPAAGWIREFAVRAGAIWGRVEWTVRAAAAIAAREYRYVSPVFQFDAQSGRVTRLLRAGLTNNPNLYLTAIAAAASVAARTEESTMEEFLGKLKEILGLEPGATLDEVLAAARAIASGGKDETAANAAADPARYVAIGEYQHALSELNALRAERTRERAAVAVDAAMREGKLSPAQREWAIAYCAADPRGFAAFAMRQPAIFASSSGFEDGGARDARPSGEALSAIELAICSQLSLSAADYLKRKSGRADFLSLNNAGIER